MAQGHLLPMVDIGRLLAQRDVIVTIVTTPHNATRVQKSIARAIKSGHPIRLLQLWFSATKSDLRMGSRMQTCCIRWRTYADSSLQQTRWKNQWRSCLRI
ncbi:hypothetical protein F3Y22_tig00110065pilonHSYRG00132 [Hibiscus syriacus]|uniref:Uncharacterized protein n=1 Tax=Hibiscus syriacus TaxID=106335 RepID=A0A6A3BKC9_HIBSY|nr:hypothetical protein F3Y22_tig00110065pilonHSYRG00132 [Hibiscus syriacus]